MHEIYELKDMLMQELEEYGRKGELKDVGSLDIVDKLAHAVKNLCKIIEAAEEEEYSSASYAGGGQGGNTSGARGRSGGGQGGGGSYRSSYARGRGRNARRDSMGRYSREGEMRRYSREGGYSREGDEMEEMVESIRGMMQELPQEVQRDAQKFVQALEQMM